MAVDEGTLLQVFFLLELLTDMDEARLLVSTYASVPCQFLAFTKTRFDER